MKFLSIHNALISGEDLPPTFEKNIEFYEYLLNNRVAYFYVSQISQHSNSIEKQIFEAGKKRNSIFYNTLLELKNICEKYGIEFMLYKTYKYFWEVIWGDIDIIIKKSDFYSLLDLLRSHGWNSIEDEPGKWKCTKDGYITIEPHISISWNGNVLFDSEKLWEHKILIDVQGITCFSLSLELEQLSIILKILYGPEYLDFYDYLVLHKSSIDIKQHLTSYEAKYYAMLINTPLDVQYPFFLSSWSIFYINFIRFLATWYCNKRMFIHNIYWKIRYILFKKLPYLTRYVVLWNKE